MIVTVESAPAESQRRDLIVIGGSAGAIEPLARLVGDLPREFAAAVLVVIHFPGSSRSYLPQILARAARLPVAHAEDGDPIVRGRIAVAPPGFHLVVRERRLQLVRGPRQNGHRPSIDVLFRSAAREFGPRVVAVLLSGLLDDGTAGISAVKRRQGTTIVQDPAEARYPDMPRNAIEEASVDHVLPVGRMSPCLESLLGLPMPIATRLPAEVADELDYETSIDVLAVRQLERPDPPGELTTLTCPECGGPLWDLAKEGMPHFRCYVGHAYSPRSLDAAQSAKEEHALWMSLRTLEESAMLNRRLMKRFARRGDEAVVERYRRRLDETLEAARALRRLLLRRPTSSEAGAVDAAPVEGDIHPQTWVRVDPEDALD